MGWFGKKPSPEQQTELREFADSLNAVHEACKRATDDFKLNTNALYHICFRARAEDRELQELEYLEVVDRLTKEGTWETSFERPGLPTEVAPLVNKAQRAVGTYRDFLANMQARLLSLRADDWYPKKYRKALESWTCYVRYPLDFLHWAADALQPPEPLKHDPQHGNDKLNMFVSGITLACEGHRDLFPKPLKL